MNKRKDRRMGAGGATYASVSAKMGAAKAQMLMLDGGC